MIDASNRQLNALVRAGDCQRWIVAKLGTAPSLRHSRQTAWIWKMACWWPLIPFLFNVDSPIAYVTCILNPAFQIICHVISRLFLIAVVH